MMDEVGGEPALDAEPPPGDGMSGVWGRPGGPAVLDVDEETTAAAVVTYLTQNASTSEVLSVRAATSRLQKSEIGQWL
ncbi:MAG: hypothetical protein PHN90_06580 [Methanothrix sp.]|jgi:hypothetical protein|nr:hypothetical protein [Methanothrix sp.]